MQSCNTSSLSTDVAAFDAVAYRPDRITGPRNGNLRTPRGSSKILGQFESVLFNGMKKLDSSRPSKSRVIQVCLFLVRLFLLGVVTLVLLIGVAWAFGALWFDFPVSAMRRPLAVVFGLGAIAALAFVRPRWRAQVAVAGAIALVAVW